MIEHFLKEIYLHQFKAKYKIHKKVILHAKKDEYMERNERVIYSTKKFF